MWLTVTFGFLTTIIIPKQLLLDYKMKVKEANNVKYSSSYSQLKTPSKRSSVYAFL